MVPQSNGKIFLTEERGLTEKEWFRTYSTFNFGRFNNKNKSSFGALAVLNEDTLAGGKSLQMPVTQATDIILIPTVGDIEFADTHGNTSLIQVGEVQLFSLQAGTSFTISNPFETELVNFLQLWLQPSSPLSNQSPQLFAFDIENGKNNLVSIFHHIQQITAASSTQYILSIGKFDGREETVYTLNDPKNGLFVFVIEGAFEVQYRLLHNGDGLALWNIDEVELEALSNNAVLLMLEAPL
ncbi:MAG TPA: pirin family protein [Chitinophagaceae bacterium]|nr:pirin family protein [Chitinophagaceae bacterium]